MSGFESDWPALLALLVATGVVAGLIAGMFGIGGGVVIVPALYHLLGEVGASDETRMHAAVATSLATIVVTSLRSARAHMKRGAVDMGVIRTWVPWIIFGSFAGSLLARFVPGTALTGLFGVGAMLIAVRMLVVDKPKPLRADLPGGAARAGLGTGIGFASSWMGIGGGVFGVMLLTLCGRTIHQAVGTAAGFGAAIGGPAALGFIISGLGVEGRAAGSLGYVNAPAFAVVITLTFIFAPLGARIAHAMSQSLLQRLFGAGLILVAIQMLFETFGALVGFG